VKEAYYKIGTLMKSFGIDGKIKCTIDAHAKQDFINAEHIFLFVRGQYLPYFIEEIEEMGDFLVKIEDVNNKEDAGLIANKDIFLHESQIHHFDPKESIPKDELIGLKIFDKDIFRAEVVDLLENTEQTTLIVKTLNGRDGYIPFSEDLILEYKPDEGELYLDLPDGLWELYT
jgi:ribosomal 30S subunit maturation factor RimM